MTEKKLENLEIKHEVQFEMTEYVMLTERQQYFISAMDIVPWMRREQAADQVFRCAIYRFREHLLFLELEPDATALQQDEYQLLSDLAFAFDAPLEVVLELTDTENHLETLVEHASAEVWCFGQGLVRWIKANTEITVTHAHPTLRKLIEKPLLKREIDFALA